MNPLYARHRLDIGARDLVAAAACMTATDRERLARRLEARWSPHGLGLACYSVRSGFHLLLRALDLPPGAEVVFSAVTHPDMPRLAAHHGLLAVPADLDPATLAPRPEALRDAITSRTRLVVIAHLFGGRVDTAPVASICREKGLVLVEDCAQAFAGPEDTGDALADVSLFSFGILKTATALGGAMLTVRDPDLLRRMRAIQVGWPVQKRRSQLKRIVQTAAFVALTRPVPYALVARLSAALQVDFDHLVNSAAKAFPAASTSELVRRLEQRPGAQLLRLMELRLARFDHLRLFARAASGERLAELVPAGIHVGGAALDHTHWLFPVVSDHADELIAAARAAGFDAARSASSVQTVAAPEGRPELDPVRARHVMSRLVFLPAYPELPPGQIERLAAAIEASSMHRLSRAETLERLTSRDLDMVVIGGGIVGARIAVEGARLGLSVALIEAGDFGGGTSSASSKVVHGGFRYLPMGDIGLVRQSQAERRVLMEQVAPNLVRRMPFLLPVYRGGSTGPATVAAGLALYRALSGGAGAVGILGVDAALNLVPELRAGGLRICGMFEEAETIDSRLVLATVKAAAGAGALVLNHAAVTNLELRHNRAGAIAITAEDAGVIEIRARHIVNAAGPWVDRLRRLDDPSAEPLVRLSKGVHLLLAGDFDWRCGVAMPLTAGRVALGIPWQGMLMLGTTDSLYTGDPSEVEVTAADKRQVLVEASGFLPSEWLLPQRVQFQTAGLRALPIAEGDTAAGRRGHVIEVSHNGLVSVAGGKLTTHRLIACDALRRVPDPRLTRIDPDSRRLPGTGWSLELACRRDLEPDIAGHLERLYGDEAGRVLDLGTSTPGGLDRIHPAGPDVWAQVAYARQAEWALDVDDIARRRTTLAVRGLATDEIVGRIRAYEAGVRSEALPRPSAVSAR